MCKAFLPIFQRQSIAGAHEGARIVNIASVAARISGLGMSAYSASKHATLAFTTALRNELKPWKVQVAAINPSFHGTQLVTTMETGLRHTWEQLTPAKQVEYGQGKRRRVIITLLGLVCSLIIFICFVYRIF
jgi:NAD(P)-dependent dehydrogenase (short-subunit alcohol dehydrogenase family)